MKILTVIHRALREVDHSFREELINYGRSRSDILNMAHFKDDSSPNAWDYSAWDSTYALYLEEGHECFRVLKHEIETDPPVSYQYNIVSSPILLCCYCTFSVYCYCTFSVYC
ncbi:hypothetical protein MKW98_011426 [Papaver atlanticum]|uniref:ENTH domain-containing protein n=1 Tax=Papaver atlanticum TaxID=357466 RepID=A0AAD4SJJ2_9MAGN|nr:hypothetical protein MKW98_011426 [Papaver atlanticum]